MSFTFKASSLESVKLFFKIFIFQGIYFSIGYLGRCSLKELILSLNSLQENIKESSE